MVGGVKEEKEAGTGRTAEGKGRERNSRDVAGKNFVVLRETIILAAC